MDKKNQICYVSETIQNLSDLIFAIHTDGYTTEQAVKYYKEIINMNMLKPGKDPEVIETPPYIIHICIMIKSLAQLITTVERRENVTEEQVVAYINKIAGLAQNPKQKP